MPTYCTSIYCFVFFIQTAEQELDFKVKKSSSVVRPDGSISVFMKCPINECMDGFTATYKGYPRQNQQNLRSIQAESSKNSVTSRWNYASMRSHLLKFHGSDEK